MSQPTPRPAVPGLRVGLDGGAWPWSHPDYPGTVFHLRPFSKAARERLQRAHTEPDALIEATAKHVLAGWENLQNADGTEIPNEPEALAVDVLCALPENLRAALLEAAGIVSAVEWVRRTTHLASITLSPSPTARTMPS